MAQSIEVSDFRKGLKILHNDQPYSIVDFQHVKPGKGNAFTRTKIKNLHTGAVIDITYRSGERLIDPEVEDRTMTFLYRDGDNFHFMDAKNYEQVELQADVVGDAANYLLADMSTDIIFFRGRAINLEIPQQIVVKIAHCEPGVRGDTATNVTKQATIETGATVAVPIFINIGDAIKVDTGTGKYIERVSIA